MVNRVLSPILPVPKEEEGEKNQLLQQLAVASNQEAQQLSKLVLPSVLNDNIISIGYKSPDAAIINSQSFVEH